MRGIARLGDICSGHSAYPPRPIIETQKKVFVLGVPFAVEGNLLAPHCRKRCHTGKLTSNTHVFINGERVGKITSKVSCGGVIKTGSNKVYCK